MNHPFMKLPDDTHLFARARVDKTLKATEPGMVEAVVWSDLHRQLAAALVKSQKRVTDHEFYTDYEVDVYVLTPDQLYRLIQEEAMRLEMMRHRPSISP